MSTPPRICPICRARPLLSTYEQERGGGNGACDQCTEQRLIRKHKEEERRSARSPGSKTGA